MSVGGTARDVGVSSPAAAVARNGVVAKGADEPGRRLVQRCGRRDHGHHVGGWADGSFGTARVTAATPGFATRRACRRSIEPPAAVPAEVDGGDTKGPLNPCRIPRPAGRRPGAVVSGPRMLPSSVQPRRRPQTGAARTYQGDGRRQSPTGADRPWTVRLHRCENVVTTGLGSRTGDTTARGSGRSGSAQSVATATIAPRRRAAGTRRRPRAGPPPWRQRRSGHASG